jgi:hypothetical protein
MTDILCKATRRSSVALKSSYRYRAAGFHCLLRTVLTVFIGISTVFSSQSIPKQAKLGNLAPGEQVLWTDPGDVSSLDFTYGVGGPESQPRPPFRFVDEDMSGTITKVNVIDSRGTNWNVKWGDEAHASTFCSRLLWACGYFAETEYFLAHGRIGGAHGLKRASSRISDDGSFKNARFQLRKTSPKYLEGYSWAWTNNPFSGTRELQGLKILVLLVSNWDTKDARDAVEKHGKLENTNLAIFEDNSSAQPRYLYSDVDWGASMGRWGGKLSWSKWDYKGFAGQTRDFLKGVENGELKWGFDGKHRKDITRGITVEDVRWLLQYLGKITDVQLQCGLKASGADPDETEFYTQALQERIQQLQRVVTGHSRQTTSAQDGVH